MSSPYPISYVSTVVPVPRLSVENRWALAGLLLAAAMVFLLHHILVDNIEQVKNRRLAQEQRVQERHHCAMMRSAIERDQCLVALSQPDIVSDPVMAQR